MEPPDDGDGRVMPAPFIVPYNTRFHYTCVNPCAPSRYTVEGVMLHCTTLCCNVLCTCHTQPKCFPLLPATCTLYTPCITHACNAVTHTMYYFVMSMTMLHATLRQLRRVCGGCAEKVQVDVKSGVNGVGFVGVQLQEVTMILLYNCSNCHHTVTV